MLAPLTINLGTSHAGISVIICEERLFLGSPVYACIIVLNVAPTQKTTTYQQLCYPTQTGLRIDLHADADSVVQSGVECVQ